MTATTHSHKAWTDKGGHVTRIGGMSRGEEGTGGLHDPTAKNLCNTCITSQRPGCNPDHPGTRARHSSGLLVLIPRAAGAPTVLVLS